jgi:hypothetical protein
MAPARFSTSGRSVPSMAASAMGTAAWWWGIMSWRKSLSASAGGAFCRRSISSGEAIPGMRPSVGWPIQDIVGSTPVAGRFQASSQPCMRPIWPCCVRAMSAARSRISSLSVLSRTISAISTACAWCTDMSRANPASAEPSPGSAFVR